MWESSVRHGRNHDLDGGERRALERVSGAEGEEKTTIEGSRGRRGGVLTLFTKSWRQANPGTSWAVLGTLGPQPPRSWTSVEIPPLSPDGKGALLFSACQEFPWAVWNSSSFHPPQSRLCGAGNTGECADDWRKRTPSGLQRDENAAPQTIRAHPEHTGSTETSCMYGAPRRSAPPIHHHDLGFRQPTTVTTPPFLASHSLMPPLALFLKTSSQPDRRTRRCAPASQPAQARRSPASL